MKFAKISLALFAAVLLLASCIAAPTASPVVQGTTANQVTPTILPTETAAETPGATPTLTPGLTTALPTEVPTVVPTQIPTQVPQTPTKAPTPTPRPTQAAELAGSSKGYDYNNLVGVDHFGRTFAAVSGMKQNRYVGMFFWLWMGQHGEQAIYDATKILAMPNGKDILLYQENNPASPNNNFHWWGEPIWGYYNTADDYVIRRQLKMIAQAGVDFIYFDTTNAITYSGVYKKICRIIDEYQKEGFKMPQIAFYTHSVSMDTVRTLYAELYKPNLYPDTWFRINGKPLIIAYTNPADDIAEAKSRGDNNYNPAPYSTEIKNFFFFKKPNWPFDSTYSDGFPWVEWKYPQPLHSAKPTVMNVTVASHPGVPMSFSLSGRSVNWGRGWNPSTKQNVTANVEKGTFFQLQWDNAIAADPDIISVGGWNEWVAIKQPYGGEYMLCDAVNMEYSRDIEPMKGGYEDAFFLQLASNIRRYKGLGKSNVSYAAKTININNAVSQWNSIEAVYRNIGQTEIARNYAGSAYKMNLNDSKNLRYTTPAPRNNIQEIRVTHDSQNIYFLVRADANITNPAGSDWMNIYIGTGAPSQKGWNGYEYLINRNLTNGKGSIEKLSSGYGRTSTGNWAEFSVQGKYMQVKISRAALGIGSGTPKLYFKIADAVVNPHDILNTYTSGISLPMGRLSYWYEGK